MPTEAGKRLLRMFMTETTGNGHTRWPRAFDARLAERIVEEFVPMIEQEASAQALREYDSFVRLDPEGFVRSITDAD
jgi:hypothetical protein